MPRLVDSVGIMLAKDALNQDFDFCSGAFAQCPVDGDAFVDPSHQFGGDGFEIAVTLGTRFDVPHSNKF